MKRKPTKPRKPSEIILGRTNYEGVIFMTRAFVEGRDAVIANISDDVLLNVKEAKKLIPWLQQFVSWAEKEGKK